MQSMRSITFIHRSFYASIVNAFKKDSVILILYYNKLTEGVSKNTLVDHKWVSPSLLTKACKRAPFVGVYFMKNRLKSLEISK